MIETWLIQTATQPRYFGDLGPLFPSTWPSSTQGVVGIKEGRENYVNNPWREGWAAAAAAIIYLFVGLFGRSKAWSDSGESLSQPWIFRTFGKEMLSIKRPCMKSKRSAFELALLLLRCQSPLHIPFIGSFIQCIWTCSFSVAATSWSHQSSSISQMTAPWAISLSAS